MTAIFTRLTVFCVLPGLSAFPAAAKPEVSDHRMKDNCKEL